MWESSVVAVIEIYLVVSISKFDCSFSFLLTYPRFALRAHIGLANWMVLPDAIYIPPK